MLRYLFTNDLRISTLNGSLEEAAEMFLMNTVPSATDNKSKNNNVQTLGFYFCLKNQSNCSKTVVAGDVRAVVLNFIKKFQFPNKRTDASYNASIEDGIKLVPMRSILKLLYLIYMNEGENGYLKIEEMKNFIFYNEKVAKATNPDIIEVYQQIKLFRNNGVYPETIVSEVEREWRDDIRQVREMTKILTWSGCVEEFSNGTYRIKHDSLTDSEKAEIFDIITCNSFWEGGSLEEYYSYMDLEEVKENPREIETSLEERRVSGGTNILLYGVPGSGKSHTIKDKYCDDETRIERVVFHPDYTYSDFTGQILPQAEGEKIFYKFVPGPFTRILEKSYQNPETKYYLIVEEINRGNAPAIFGDIFQLLDRDEKGNSVYGISNTDIAEAVYSRKSKLVIIPSNLSILATMNTSDQNVFTLDTAFQRRWKMKMIENKVEKAKEIVNVPILDSTITWGEFNININKQIIASNEGMTSSEDKRLGAYFVGLQDLLFNSKEDSTEESEKIRVEAKEENGGFPEKVLKYLWDDAFKFNREAAFDTEKYKSLEDIIAAFEKARSNKRFSVFRKDLFNIENEE